MITRKSKSPDNKLKSFTGSVGCFFEASGVVKMGENIKYFIARQRKIQDIST